MPLVDPTTDVGKLRLRCGDWADLPILPDSVYEAVLVETEDNLPQASTLCAQYILATLTTKTHRKLGQLETWGGEQFNNYVKFLKLTILNPNLMQISPVPYGTAGDDPHPLIQFVQDWNNSYAGGRCVVIPADFDCNC